MTRLPRSRLSVSGRLSTAFLAMVVVMLAACGRAPGTATSSPTGPTESGASSVTSEPSSAAEPAHVNWKSYENASFGFSFEYPDAYDDPQNSDACGLTTDVGTNEVTVRWGARSVLTAFTTHAETPEDLIQTHMSQDATQVQMTSVVADGFPGVKATFRFGGPSRFGEIYAFIQEGHGYVGAFTAGAMCEPQGLSLLEPAAFEHAMETLKFDP